MRFARVLLSVLALQLCLNSGARGQMVEGAGIPGFAETMQLDVDDKAHEYSVQYVGSTAPGNVLWPGEQASFTFQITSKMDEQIQTSGKVDVVQYGTKGRPGDIWTPDMVKFADARSVPVKVSLAPRGYQDLTVAVEVPEVFGAWALVLDLGKYGRHFVTAFVRTFKADAKPIQYPQLCMDVDYPPVLTRLGGAPNRIGISFKPTTDGDFKEWYKGQGERLMALKRANKAVTIEFGAGEWKHECQPLGRERPWLNDDGLMMDTKSDICWMPSWDPEFRKLVKMFVMDFGWPKGPVNGVMLWNEPWNGISISGWGADDIRYRTLYRVMAEATEEGEREAGVEVLIGGCDSSSNTFDKLFADGSDEFLKWLDFCSIHYQGMEPPSTVKKWVDRKHPHGRVRIWDTESWVANCDDRVAAVVATNLSTGHDRAVGIYHGNICTASHDRWKRVSGPDGKQMNVEVSHTWSVGAAVGAVTHFIGERKFRELLFTNGLPWVMIFDGIDDPDDSSIVIVGDIGDEFGHDSIPFRTARSLAELRHEEELAELMSELPADAAEERAELQGKIDAIETRTEASMTLDAQSGRFSLYDFYGNPVPSEGGKIVVPLDHRGYFLRADGSQGSFEALRDAIRTSRIDGIEPLATVCRDMLAPVNGNAVITLELTNVLNRPVSGSLSVTVASLEVQAPSTLSFAPHETKTVRVPVLGGEAASDNAYRLELAFDAGADGRALHAEVMHVNLISRRRITVDGRLDDWKGALPQTVATNERAKPTLTEYAWQPFKVFDTSMKKGLATAYVAYDDENMYFAAKIADETPHEGMPRYETADEDEYFYPETSFALEAGEGGRDAENFSVRWTGFVKPQYGEKYSFSTLSDDGIRVWVDGKILVDNWSGHGDTWDSGATVLEADRLYPIKVEFYQGGGGATLQLHWESKRQKKELVPAEALFVDQDGLTPGLNATYYRGTDLQRVAQTRVDATIDFKDWPGDIAQPTFGVPVPPGKRSLTWPEGVRRFSYRKGPVLPAGNAPNTDNVQLAFNVLPDSQKPWYPFPPGTLKGYTGYYDTDYEYALNKVAAKYGDGVEIWRLRYPGMPHKHFYPHNFKSPLDGAVKDGKLVIIHEGNTRITECAIPWSEIPGVKARLDARETIKFSFRVNDNAGVGCMELARRRSVAKRNGSFRVDWTEHWANELEFAFEDPSKAILSSPDLPEYDITSTEAGGCSASGAQRSAASAVAMLLALGLVAGTGRGLVRAP